MFAHFFSFVLPIHVFCTSGPRYCSQYSLRVYIKGFRLLYWFYVLIYPLCTCVPRQISNSFIIYTVGVRLLSLH